LQGLWFDGRYIDPVHPDGISRYSVGLITALAEHTDVTVIVDSPAQEEALPKHQNIRFYRANKLVSLKELTLGLRLNKQGVRLLFSPMQTTLALGRKFKLVSTLHDLIYYRHRTPPSDFNMFIRAVWFLYHLVYWPQRLMLKAADAVATVSETSAEQITAARLTRRPLRVIHNASMATASVPRKNRSNSKQLVYMGSFIEYKNVETLIRGMGHLPEHRLLLLSRIKPERKQLLQALAEEVGATVIFLDGVSDETYQTLLDQSQALVSASLDEGFGIPVVEAMSHGCPVVLSDIPIFEEVAGAAGLRFRPKDPADFAAQVRRLDDPKVWKLQSQLGVVQAKFFTWEDSAELLLELAEELTA
jgi:glycosyltransferase involved in cell wall biosynthesis